MPKPEIRLFFPFFIFLIQVYKKQIRIPSQIGKNSFQLTYQIFCRFLKIQWFIAILLDHVTIGREKGKSRLIAIYLFEIYIQFLWIFK